MGNVLVIEDNDTMREGLLQILAKAGHYTLGVRSGREGIEVCQREEVDLVLSDVKMDDMNGLDVLEYLKRTDQDIVVMLMTAYGTIELAVDAMRKGAFDFITKPFSPDVLKIKVEKAIRVGKLASENRRLHQYQEYHQLTEKAQSDFSEIKGHSAKTQEIIRKINKVAQTDSSVIITGESGTGKELVARAIHFNSQRKDAPFIKVNCGALAEGILESELFGHEKGSFTGALKRKIGRFELADGGTIFLDEIGDFNASIQLKLLRVLQEREFERVGGTQTVRVNVRVVSATNKHLEDEIKRGTFRSDLYYRLHIFPIEMPPLRERRDDIPELAEHFLLRTRKGDRRDREKPIVGFTEGAMTLLKDYPWPGNIRELENTIEQSCVMCDSERIDVGDLPAYLRGAGGQDFSHYLDEGMSLNEALEKVERDMILKAYERANTIKAETARLLGIKTSALYYKLEKYGIT